MTTPAYKVSASGGNYISNPSRNKKGRITTRYFKDLILIFVLVKGYYEPSKFKDYVESLHILSENDRKRMPTRQYVEWKHYSDAAKQGLYDTGQLIEFEKGRFRIPPDRLSEALAQVSGFIEK